MSTLTEDEEEEEEKEEVVEEEEAEEEEAYSRKSICCPPVYVSPTQGSSLSLEKVRFCTAMWLWGQEEGPWNRKRPGISGGVTLTTVLHLSSTFGCLLSHTVVGGRGVTLDTHDL